MSQSHSVKPSCYEKKEQSRDLTMWTCLKKPAWYINIREEQVTDDLQNDPYLFQWFLRFYELAEFTETSAQFRENSIAN